MDAQTRFFYAILRGAKAFGDTAMKAWDSQKAITVTETAPAVIEAAKETTPTPDPDPAPAVETPNTRTVEAATDSTTTATETPAETPETPTEPPVVETTATAEGGHEFKDMDRGLLVAFIKDNGIGSDPAFQAEFPEPKVLKGRKAAAIRRFLEKWADGGGQPASQQAPPEKTTTTTTAPAEELAAIAEPPAEAPAAPTNGVSKDVAADDGVREKATALVELFKGNVDDPNTGSRVRAFWANWGCEGDCLGHDKASIERCYDRLNKPEPTA